MNWRSTPTRTPTTIFVPVMSLLLLAASGLSPSPSLAAPEGDVPDVTATRMTHASVVATLKREIPPLMAEGHVVGLTITLVDGDRTVWRAGFGQANREADRPVTTTTLFHIGSTSKTMTAMAIMQLVERGLVDLDAPFTRYVPQLRMLPRFRDDVITVRDVMTHHSGIPGDLINLPEIATAPDSQLDRQLLRALRKQQPVRRAGEAWAYSNVAITLLQNVVENVTGQPFEQYTRRRIFEPLGMRSSSFNDARQPGRKVAAGYRYVTGQTVQAVRQPREYVNIRPAGSVYSNARDMARYLKAMIGFGKAPDGARVLQSDTVRQMITPQPTSPWDRMFFTQGLVWWIGYGATWLRQVVNHGGDTYLHHSMAAWSPSNRVGVFVSINTGTDAAPVLKEVWQRALGLLITAKTGLVPAAPKPPAPVAAPDPAELRRMAGRYANTEGLVRLRPAGDQLSLTAAAQLPDATARLLDRRRDGWYTTDDGQESVRMIRIEGNRALLIRLADGTSGLFAQEVAHFPRVPARWRERVGTYRITNVDPTVHPVAGIGDRMPLYQRDGLLFLGNMILRPAGPTLAYDFGVSPMQVMRDSGFSVRAEGKVLWWKGLRLVRVARGVATQSAPDISALTPPLVPEVGR